MPLIDQPFKRVVIDLVQWFLTFISLPNPYVILLWFEKIFLFFIVLNLFYLSCWTLSLFSSLSFFFYFLVFVLFLFFLFIHLFFIFYRPLTFFFCYFFLVFDIFLLLFDLSSLIRSAPAFSVRARLIRITIKGGATFRF